ncbi:MAG: NAD(P)H-dependent oxidoreductase [Bacteroidales bacterium]|jgi:flavodoxin|nr:NAD(P)H-dependent oxidoreductase [Bacteroidales bacterium]
MKIKTFLLLLITTCLITYANAQESKKVLIVYFSHSGNTEAVANHIQRVTNADIFEIQTVEAYPQEYKKCTEQAKKEINEGYKPELKTKIDNIASYDIIFVGSPNWWSTIAPPVSSFLSEYDLSGKIVVPFVTHGGGDKANCFDDMEKLCSKSTFKEGIAILGTRVAGMQKDVEVWAKKIMTE